LQQVRIHRSGRSIRRLALGLVAVIVVLVGWLQFVWLSRLHDEELARRQVALRVASANFQDRIAREFQDLLDLTAAPYASPPGGLVRARVNWVPGSLRGDYGTPAETIEVGRARLQQLLGSALLQAAAKGDIEGGGIWLEPPALVHCSSSCSAWLLDLGALANGPLDEAARLLFADFGEALRLEIVSSGPEGKLARRIYPAGGARPSLSEPDLSIDLLGALPVPGPPGFTWELRVGHAGSSLEQAVAAAHLRNLLLSLVVLGLLVAGLVVIDRYSRNRAALAEQRILFVASASHELRTPLSVIGSAADNLAEGTVSDAERVREYGALIRSEVAKLTAMIDNVLDFSEATGKPREFVSVALDRVLEEALSLCRPALSDRELRLDLASDPPTVLGQPAALRSLVVNLLNNAAKYAEGEGAIRIALRTVSSGRRRALALSVTNPVGTRSEADPERWFEPFHRGKDALARRIPGTGIGLSVARSIARQHGGDLTVLGGDRGWIRFVLYLPLGD
jgi:signal transduction histidine kinase